ncbi:MAG: cation:proton antiporter [Candidatus Acidiferrum sp.]
MDGMLAIAGFFTLGRAQEVAIACFAYGAADGSSAAHTDPVAPILIALVLLAFGAMVGGHLTRKLKQPAVLGELLVGMLVGNLAHYFREPLISILREGDTVRAIMSSAFTKSVSLAEAARDLLPATSHTQYLVEILNSPNGPIAIEIYQFVDILSRIAIIFLLFLVGLETSVYEMRKVGKTSFLVAVVGILAPFLLGIGAMKLLEPSAGMEKGLFVGVILVATSVGITARIFRDLKQEHRVEAKIILGAAVIDDVLGLLFLAVLSGFVATGNIDLFAVGLTTVKAFLFLAGAIGLGIWMTPKLIRLMARLEIENVKLQIGLGFAFLFAWLASLLGLATIIGAFAAGLVLEEMFFKELKEEHSLRHLLSPFESLIIPLFFVLMGMQVKLELFGDFKVVLTAAVITVAAIIGKLISGMICPGKLSRLSVGLGMMPRGEVTLVFAGVGRELGVIGDGLFSAVVIMVMVTTLLTAPLLRLSLGTGEVTPTIP